MACAFPDNPPESSPAVVNSTRDLSIIPEGLLTTEFVDDYLRSKSKASGDKHVSKGYKYFHEDYVKDRQSKCTFAL